MEMLQLRYFQKVARMEHMTKAAEELRIAQPALSKTIARLEEDLGVPLFDRIGKQIRLNALGRTFLEKVDAALELLEEGRREVSDLGGLQYGSIRLAMTTLDRLSDPLGAFLAHFPDVNIQITQAATGEMARMLGAGSIDIGFTALPIEQAGLTSAIVLKEDVYLAVPRDHRFANRGSIHLSEVGDEPFIGYKEGFVMQKMNETFFRKAGISPKFVCQVDEPAAIVSLVRAGLGVAMFGCKSGEAAGITLLRVESPVCHRSYRVYWSENRYLSLAARKFLAFIEDYFREDATMQHSPLAK
ncbi:LysR family transcriptional regulator [Paenibacillus harenae]|uniref:DNA-binding transcriptional LysR family regulator n=1 Tax=Paenibacillus harenae TaxID=306543 RepID=A0ABT9TTM4_PAEHA|nr:LysR family transcriptional regulator [Paenibacillus harenae]MDQ0061450.1 DNA-binding transcriptional LysR family regulator [Paenibacillus harenae]MDQ0110691.1 DNA-binding transcriptional LysR family regulator [Paenibacillus harenae]